MADFEIAFEKTMKHEDDPSHPGKVSPEPDGAKARFGINSKAHPEAVTAGFYEMSTDDARHWAEVVFRACYWTLILGDQIADQGVADKFYDLAVNCGVHEATLFVQRALVGLGIAVLVDGKMGSHTLAAINEANPTRLIGDPVACSGGTLTLTVGSGIRLQAAEFDTDLVIRKPALKSDYAGWIARINS